MVVAGNETTTKLLGNAWYWAWRNPDQQRAALADPAGIPGWVEETLRYDTSSQLLARITTEDVPLHGGVIPAGDRVVLLVGSANRDPRAFEDPDRYDIARFGADGTGSQGLLASFGVGRHFCMGASLARLEARVALEELLARVADYDIDEAGEPAGALGQRARLRLAAHHRGAPLSAESQNLRASQAPLADRARKFGRRRADAPVRAPPRATARRGDRRVVGHRAGRGAGARRRRAPGRSRRPTGRALRGGRRRDPRRRR